MDTTLKKDIYEHQSLVFSGAAGRESSEEFVVPDTLPDVGAIVDAEGVLTLRGKDTGTGYVELAAAVSVCVLYSPENGGPLRSIEVELPADLRMDAPDADGECRTVARMRLRSLDARAVNSRKIAVRAEIGAEAQCYRRAGLELASGLAADDGAAHLLEASTEAVLVSDVREKTFVVTEDLSLPSGCASAERILSRRVETVVEDVKFLSGKAVFRGRVRAELIFASAEDGQAYAARYETEFSQIMEAGEPESVTLPQVTLMLTGAYFDLPAFGQEQGRVSAELHFAAQCVCYERRQLRYIADIYSNRTLLCPETETVETAAELRPVTVRQTVAGRAEPAPDAGEVLSVSASVGGIAVEDGAVKTSVSIRLIVRREDGSCFQSRCRLTAEFTSSEIAPGTQLRDVTVTVADAYCAGADVRATLQMDALAVTGGRVRCVSSVTEDAEGFAALESVPSATLIRIAPGQELWPVAKRYRSTLEAIAAANEGRQDGLLLIPKGR